MTEGYEVNLDGLVGPTHNYSGLSYGNVASVKNKGTASNPKGAALQGLEKMKFLLDLGLRQAVLPPHERPHIPTLKRLGFTGSDETILEKVHKTNPELLVEVSSAAAMWAANSATFTPSADSSGKHLQITPANLSSKFHRSIEAETTERILKAIFQDPLYFTHHPPLPPGRYFSDEGSANHTRFCDTYSGVGLHLFVYGRLAFKPNAVAPEKFPARQTLEACKTIVRTHTLYPDRVIYAQQSPRAIDAGVFHNDVIAVGNRNLFLFHEHSFVGGDTVLKQLREKVKAVTGVDLRTIRVLERQVPLEAAVETYLFNSQLVTLPEGGEVLIAPAECEKNEAVFAFLEECRKNPDTPLQDIHFIELQQSMRNGGGPACLRTRVPLNEKELENMNSGVLLNGKLYGKLVEWVNKHYRDRLEPKDLADPKLLQEGREALDELTKILKLGSVYDFQLKG